MTNAIYFQFAKIQKDIYKRNISEKKNECIQLVYMITNWIFGLFCISQKNYNFALKSYDN